MDIVAASQTWQTSVKTQNMNQNMNTKRMQRFMQWYFLLSNYWCYLIIIEIQNYDRHIRRYWKIWKCFAYMFRAWIWCIVKHVQRIVNLNYIDRVYYVQVSLTFLFTSDSRFQRIVEMKYVCMQSPEASNLTLPVPSPQSQWFFFCGFLVKWLKYSLCFYDIKHVFNRCRCRSR